MCSLQLLDVFHLEPGSKLNMQGSVFALKHTAAWSQAAQAKEAALSWTGGRSWWRIQG